MKIARHWSVGLALSLAACSGSQSSSGPTTPATQPSTKGAAGDAAKGATFDASAYEAFKADYNDLVGSDGEIAEYDGSPTIPTLFARGVKLSEQLWGDLASDMEKTECSMMLSELNNWSTRNKGLLDEMSLMLERLFEEVPDGDEVAGAARASWATSGKALMSATARCEDEFDDFNLDDPFYEAMPDDDWLPDFGG